MGLFGVLWKVIAVVVLAVIGLGAYLYFTDYQAQATVVERGSDQGGAYAVIAPDVYPSWNYKAYIDSSAANFVCKGYKVTFAVKSNHYQIWDGRSSANEGRGQLVYDSNDGIQNQNEIIRCGTTNTGGGILG